jgi:hypothetical protein
LATEGAEMDRMNALAAIVAVGLAVFGTASMSGAEQAGSSEDDAPFAKSLRK